MVFTLYVLLPEATSELRSEAGLGRSDGGAAALRGIIRYVCLSIYVCLLYLRILYVCMYIYIYISIHISIYLSLSL